VTIESAAAGIGFGITIDLPRLVWSAAEYSATVKRHHESDSDVVRCGTGCAGSTCGSSPSSGFVYCARKPSHSTQSDDTANCGLLPGRSASALATIVWCFFAIYYKSQPPPAKILAHNCSSLQVVRGSRFGHLDRLWQRCSGYHCVPSPSTGFTWAPATPPKSCNRF